MVLTSTRMQRRFRRQRRTSDVATSRSFARRHRRFLFTSIAGASCCKTTASTRPKKSSSRRSSSSRATPKGRTARGRLLSGSGSTRAPSRSTRSSSRDFPADASLAQNLALCYLKTGQPEKARTLLETAGDARSPTTCARGRTSGSCTSGSATTKSARRVRARAAARHGATHGGDARVRRPALDSRRTARLARPRTQGAARSVPRARTRR